MKGISIVEAGEAKGWDQYVMEHPAGTFFHLSGWKDVIERAFGHRTPYLAAMEAGRICGVLPLTNVRSRLFGSSLISNAFCVQGGILADHSGAAEALRTHARKIGEDLNVDCIEFRSADGIGPWIVKNDRYAVFRRAIEADDAKNLKAIPRKQRAVVRKAIAGTLTTDVDKDVDRLHAVYAESVRRLGTPVFSRRYFRLLRERFANACDVVTVTCNGQAVASVMNFYFREQVLPYYGGGVEKARTVGGNDFLYWEVMRRAAQRGYTLFDFGRSKVDSGAYHFKRNWGFEPAPLAYAYLPVRKAELPDINPLNPKYRLATSIWRRLPLPLTKLIGPAIVRGIG